MPDSLILNESPAHPSVSKPRCAKRKAGQLKAAQGESPASSTSSITALAAAAAASVLPSAIFRQADAIEIGTRRAKTSLDLAWDMVNELDAMGEASAKPTGITLGALSSRLYLLLGIVGDELKSAHSRADKIIDAARELKNPMPTTPVASGSDLLTLRLQLKAAEDALDEDGAPESGPIVDAYHSANRRFLEAPARTPAEMLLKLERLAEIEEMEEHPERADHQIVLNLIRDLRGALGINGQVQ